MKITVKNTELTDILGNVHAIENDQELKITGSTSDGNIIAQIKEKGQFIIIPDEVKKVIFESIWEVFTNWIKQLLKIK